MSTKVAISKRSLHLELTGGCVEDLALVDRAQAAKLASIQEIPPGILLTTKEYPRKHIVGLIWYRKIVTVNPRLLEPLAQAALTSAGTG